MPKQQAHRSTQMKVIKYGTLGIMTAFLLAAQAWGYGSHGTGKIGKTYDQLQFSRGFPIYQNFKAPISYPSFTRGDIRFLALENEVIDVEGMSSKQDIFLPIGVLLGFNPTSGVSFDWKDRGVQDAIKAAKKRYRVDLLYDVRIDVNYFSILGIYNKTTTIIHAKGIRMNSNSFEEDHP